MPVHDAWRVSLPENGGPCTMLEVRATAERMVRSGGPGPAVKALFAIRNAIGGALGWDAEPSGSPESWSYRSRLGDDVVARSLVEPGTRDGPFSVLYVHEREAVSEIRNATVHAFPVWAIRPAEGGHDLYFAVHIVPVGRVTRWYLAAIGPFRRWIVYPSLLSQFHREWVRGAS